MKKKRSKHSPAFKAKVALAAVREQESVAEIARRHNVHANVVYKWKRQLLENLSRAFEPDQEHQLHAHEGMDKVYHVLEGEGLFLLQDRELPLHAGVMMVAPAGVPHGIRNTGDRRLLVAAILAPASIRSLLRRLATDGTWCLANRHHRISTALGSNRNRSDQPAAHARADDGSGCFQRSHRSDLAAIRRRPHAAGYTEQRHQSGDHGNQRALYPAAVRGRFRKRRLARSQTAAALAIPLVTLRSVAPARRGCRSS
jgi:transposase